MGSVGAYCPNLAWDRLLRLVGLRLVGLQLVEETGIEFHTFSRIEIGAHVVLIA